MILDYSNNSTVTEKAEQALRTLDQQMSALIQGMEPNTVVIILHEIIIRELLKLH